MCLLPWLHLNCIICGTHDTRVYFEILGNPVGELIKYLYPHLNSPCHGSFTIDMCRYSDTNGAVCTSIVKEIE